MKRSSGTPDSKAVRPPRGAVLLLRAVLPADEVDPILGDITEVFLDRLSAGRRGTRLWFWRQAFVFATRFTVEPLMRRVPSRVHSRRRALYAGEPLGRRWNWDMRDLVTRFRQTIRRLWSERRYALGVVLILGIGIGPAAAMLSVVQKVLLQPLGYYQPDRLGLIRLNLGEIKGHAGLSRGEIRDLRGLEQFFAAAEGTSRELELSLGEGDAMVPVATLRVSPGLFRMLGASPMLGRHFNEDETEFFSVVMLSHGLWQTQFGGDPDIVGRTVVLNGRAVEVVGVMPPRFALHIGRGSQLSPMVDLWVPLHVNDHRNFWAFPTLVRLRDGVTFEQANVRLEALTQALTEAYPETYTGTSLGFVVHPLLPDLVRESRPAIRAALVGVVLLLIIAVANATALVAARLKARELDFAIRSALGAGRRALVTDVFVESAVLTMGGAALGGAVASAGIMALRSFIPRTVPRWDTIAVGWDVLGYSAVLALLGLLLAGLIPAWRVSRSAPLQTLRRTSQQGGSRRESARFALVGTQIALAVVLSFGAVQLGRSAMRLAAADIGFEPLNVLAFRVPFDGRVYDGARQEAEFYQRVRDRLRELPGVQAVGAISHLPLSGTGPIDAYTPDMADSAGMSQAMANYFAVMPGYLESVRIPLRNGRYFTDTENVKGEQVIIIDETLARLAFPGEDPIGRPMRLGWGLPNSRIVGVVANARVIDVSQDVRPQIYVPYGLFRWSPLHFTVRADGNPRALVAAARDAVTELGSGRAVSSFQLLADNVTTAMSTLRSVTILVAVLAISAALLSALGLYAVISYVVHQRRRSTAIRSALGASPGRLLRHHLANGGAILLVAVPVGVALSVAGARFFGSLVYGVGIRDVRSLAAAAVLAALAGLIGTYLPARSAAKEDPVRALRAE